MSEDTFREIERGHEAKYKLDEELRFKAQCRRNKLLGAWAATHMGMAPAEADAYARKLVAINLDQAGTAPVIDDVCAASRKAGREIDRAEVVAALERFYAEALASLTKDYPRALGPDHVQVGG